MGFNRASLEFIGNMVGKALWTYSTADNIASAVAVGTATANYWTNVHLSSPNMATGDLILAVQEANLGSAVLTAWVCKNSGDRANVASMLRVL